MLVPAVTPKATHCELRWTDREGARERERERVIKRAREKIGLGRLYDEWRVGYSQNRLNKFSVKPLVFTLFCCY